MRAVRSPSKASPPTSGRFAARDRCVHEGSALKRTGPRTGLLGGSFNPAHGAHRKISLAALQALALDEVWWLVSPGNPMKSQAGMAPLAARYAAALVQARRAPIRVTAIERQFGTPYTAETLRKLLRRYPRRRFVWLMGTDNLAQFHRWKKWRAIARMVPIAVVARPSYDGGAMASPAMAWLGRFRISAASLKHRAAWSAPALVIFRFDPDPRSATAIRLADPDWASRLPRAILGASGLRDRLTLRPIEPTS